MPMQCGDEMRWKAVPGFPDYEVSTGGDVRSTKGRRPRILRRRFLPTGYVRCALYRDCAPVHLSVHRLVWEAFVGDIPPKMQINHKNGVKDDNRLSNLEVVTVSENMTHKFRELGHTGRRGSKSNWAVLTERDIPIIRDLRERGLLYREIAERFGVSRAAVAQIVKRERWAHVP